MSITPWSWERSNGSATEQQTKKAHNALLTNMNTSLFSRFVWNDIVQKAYALCLELGSTWNSHYLSKSDTFMDEPYSELSAKMFNSLRLNTRYPAWTWNYDTATPGYIGRTDFRGRAEVGAILSDTVYGYYIVEITEAWLHMVLIVWYLLHLLGYG